MRGIEGELGAVGIRQARHVARVFDHGQLHAQADAQEGHLVLAGELDGPDLALDAALAEAARHQDGVVVGQHGGAFTLDLLGVEVVDGDAGGGVHAGMHQRLGQRLVGLGEVDVLADHGNAHVMARMLQPLDEGVPDAQVCGRTVELEQIDKDVVDLLLVQHARDLVDGVGIAHGDDRIHRNVGKERDLGALVIGDGTVGPAQHHVGLDADLAQLLQRVLGGLGLELAGLAQEGHQREVHEAGVAAPDLQAHLPGGLEERQGFDVTHGAADLDDGDLGLGRGAHARATLDEGLDLVGDVRDDLHRAAQVLAPTFLADDGVVDLTGGEVVGAAHARRNEALVVAQVQVGLGAVLGDEDLAVLERAHGARVDVDVGIKLHQRDVDPPRLQERGHRGGGYALAQGRDHAAGDKYIFGHVCPSGNGNCSNDPALAKVRRWRSR